MIEDAIQFSFGSQSFTDIIAAQSHFKDNQYNMYIFNSKFPGGFQANNDHVSKPSQKKKKKTQRLRSKSAFSSSTQGCSRQMCLFLLFDVLPPPPSPQDPAFLLSPTLPHILDHSLPSVPPPKFNTLYSPLKVISSDLWVNMISLFQYANKT